MLELGLGKDPEDHHTRQVTGLLPHPARRVGREGELVLELGLVLGLELGLVLRLKLALVLVLELALELGLKLVVESALELVMKAIMKTE